MQKLLLMSLATMHGRHQKGLYNITVGQQVLPEFTYRGYHLGDSTGLIVNSNIDGYTVTGAYVDSQQFFQVQILGNTSSRPLRVTPENYGGSLGPITGALIGDTTYYWTSLPNNNLYNNWTPGSQRTCLLELL